MYTEGEKFGP